MINWISNLLMFFGRICLGIIFLWSAFDKLINFNFYTDFITSHMLPRPELYLLGAILVEVFGGLSLLFGYWTRLGAAVLLIYMIPTTLIFHDFWLIREATEKHLQTILFLKNLAIFGGLLYVLSCGPGLFSFKENKRSKPLNDDDQL